MISKSHTKYIQSLQHKKFRDEYGLFIGEGPKVVTELLAAGRFSCHEIFAEEKWLKENAGGLQKFPVASISALKDFELQKISALHTANKIIGVFEKAPNQPIENTRGRVSLALDTIQDPGNFGTIIRIGDWFGIENIICSPGCADLYNPKVVQSTMGSISRVNIYYTELAEWLDEQPGINIYGADMNGTNIRLMKPLEEGIIVIGNEGHGISAPVMKRVTERIAIPGRGDAESLNAAVATGIILAQLT